MNNSCSTCFCIIFYPHNVRKHISTIRKSTLKFSRILLQNSFKVRIKVEQLDMKSDISFVFVKVTLCAADFKTKFKEWVREQCHLICGFRFVLSLINFNFDVISLDLKQRP